MAEKNNKIRAIFSDMDESTRKIFFIIIFWSTATAILIGLVILALKATAPDSTPTQTPDITATIQQALADARNFGVLTGGTAEDILAFNSPNAPASAPPSVSSNWPVDWKKDGSLTNEAVINMDGGGTITVLPDGKFEAPNPQTPNANLAQFSDHQSRRIALPVGLSNEMSTGDFSKTSFSGAMASKEDSRLDFECDQFVFIEEFCEKIMEWWLYTEWIYGPEEVKLALQGYGDDPDEYNAAVSWQYNGEQTLNPLQQVNASFKQIELGQASYRSAAAVIGSNFDDNMENQDEELDLLIAREQKRLRLLGLKKERQDLETGKNVEK